MKKIDLIAITIALSLFICGAMFGYYGNQQDIKAKNIHIKAEYDANKNKAIFPIAKPKGRPIKAYTT